MNSITEIQSTRKYDKFHLFSENRSVSPAHIERLEKDPTFAAKFCMSPIIITKDFYIIDGQHRYFAAKNLNIPIFYIIDEDGSRQDIRSRNMNMVPWKGIEYVHFYSEKSESYAFLESMMKKHKVPLTFLGSVIKKIAGLKHIKYTYDLKKGTLNFNKHIPAIRDCIELIIPYLKNCRTIKGEKPTRPIFTDAYVNSFAYFFINDRKTLEKALKNLDITDFNFPYTTTFETARGYIEKIAHWRPVKSKKEI